MTTALSAPALPKIRAVGQPGYSPFWDIWLGLRRSPSGLVGLIIVALHLALALAAPAIVPYDPAAFDTAAIRAAPSAEHLFGTDKLGRDVFTRTLLGGRIALLVTMVGTGLAITWGGLLGMTLAYVGGIVDEIVMRLVDTILALPRLLILLLIASLFGTATGVLILALGFLFGISVIRIARATTLDFVARDFIIAAYAMGARPRTIIFRELLPNVLDILLVEGALRWSWMLLSFSALSFLGFGVTPPTPDWGLMIADSRDVLALSPWATFFPIGAISTLIIGVNLLAGALAKALGLDRGGRAAG
ncbi:MAG: ABC transporter permease [Caldilinea sp. CFX5]|nr:ABC transporter permease [Caldilinea sp. CFX5]